MADQEPLSDSREQKPTPRLDNRIAQFLFVDEPNWIGEKITRSLKDNPAFALTVLYVFVSGLGLFFEFILFSEFDLNILDYSEATDFFLADFKRPEALLVSLGAAGVFGVYWYVANKLRKWSSSFKYVLYIAVWIGLFRREILNPYRGRVFSWNVYYIRQGRSARYLEIQ